jgi:deoxyribodipyrimidine photo-lyase
MHIHIFRRDLRLEDNTALNNIHPEAQIIPIFIFTPEQIEKNEYKSPFAVHFLIESLKELHEDLTTYNSQLHIFKGKIIEILSQIHKRHKIRQITFNSDYTPYAKKRDAEIKAFAKEHNIECLSYEDALLTNPALVHKDDNKPYTIYTPFYKKASLSPVNQPQTNPKLKNQFKKLKEYNAVQTHDILEEIRSKHELPSTENKKVFLNNQANAQGFTSSERLTGGRSNGLKLLKRLQNLSEYTTNRDIPSLSYTSHLSPHHKFGTISIRETYHIARQHLGEGCQYIKELYWRDFATYIAFHFPHVFGKEFQHQYQNLEWEYTKESNESFKKWCEGKTGFPIVDAGMRELNMTGYMHNRVRMIVASFLTKDLHIDWRLGEKYFAQKLIDYDPSVNNTSWQWAASTGCDAQPYFRIFNPWLQQEKFDPHCEYIKRWVTELRTIDPKDIHTLHKNRPLTLFDNPYPKPIVDHAVEKDKAIAMFKGTTNK